MDVRAATEGGAGVDRIIDCVGASAADPTLCDTLRPNGPKEYAEVFTGPPVTAPNGVKHHTFFGPCNFDKPGGVNAMPAVTKLITQAWFRIGVDVETAGHGFDAIPEGSERLREGVSGKKLLVTI